MKTSYVATALIVTIAAVICAQSSTSAPLPQDTPWAVVNRDGSSKTYERMTYEKTPGGQVISHRHQYAEVATGMHYLQNGKWTESNEQINSVPGGAVAWQGQHQVTFTN